MGMYLAKRVQIARANNNDNRKSQMQLDYWLKTKMQLYPAQMFNYMQRETSFF